jgi:hypothetical protein
MQLQRKRILACDGTHWMLMSVNTNLEKAPGWRWLWEVHSKEKIPGSRPIRRIFLQAMSNLDQFMDCVGDYVYSVTVFHLSKSEQF